MTYRALLIPLIALSLLVWSLTGRADEGGQLNQTTTTPIKHLIVIFDENVSFDHYFATYPYAENPVGEPAFYPREGTPTVNGLTPALRAHNPNPVGPFRLDRSQAITCDNDNHYSDEQRAYNGGLLNQFSLLSAVGPGCGPDLEMAQS